MLARELSVANVLKARVNALSVVDRIHGCNRCQFRWMCGAAQAWLNTLTRGSWDKPLCAYEPRTFPFASNVLVLAGIN
jgi:hypothetical protein